MINIGDLNYEKILDQYLVTHGLSQSAEIPDYFIHCAQEDHGLIVKDALRKALLHASGDLPRYLVQEQAQFYARYGAARRFAMVHGAFCSIFHIAPPDRCEPLQNEEGQTLTIEINVIYMNVRAILDNYAWVVLYEKIPDKVGKIRRQNVDLFGKCINDYSNLSPLACALQSYRDWNKEIKERRDPVAHRIPLYVPPSFLNPEERKRYNELFDQHLRAALEQHDFETSDAAWAELESLGRFPACFMHHPKESSSPLFPTISTDIANLLKIYCLVSEFLCPAQR